MSCACGGQECHFLVYGSGSEIRIRIRFRNQHSVPNPIPGLGPKLEHISVSKTVPVLYLIDCSSGSSSGSGFRSGSVLHCGSCSLKCGSETVLETMFEHQWGKPKQTPHKYISLFNLMTLGYSGV